MSSAAHERLDGMGDESDRIAQYVAKLVAQAPPISAVTRAKLAALLGAPTRTRRVA